MFGLSVSIQKTKLLVVRYGINAGDVADIPVGDGEIDCESVPYLGSLIIAIGDEVDRCITNAFKAFGALNKSVFNDNNLTFDTVCYQYCYIPKNVGYHYEEI